MKLGIGAPKQNAMSMNVNERWISQVDVKKVDSCADKDRAPERVEAVENNDGLYS